MTETCLFATLYVSQEVPHQNKGLIQYNNQDVNCHITKLQSAVSVMCSVQCVPSQLASQYLFESQHLLGIRKFKNFSDNYYLNTNRSEG